MDKNKTITFFSVLIFLSLFAAFVVLCVSNAKKRDELESLDLSYTEYVFVYVTSESSNLQPLVTQSPLINYTLKEYCGMIGVFSAQGKLVRVIEIYTKTLPEADRTLLREGIHVYSEEELNAIIEDYSG